MSKIRLLVMDVDGTLTDGKIYMGQNGELMKAFDVKDGYAIANILPRLNIIPVIITGRSSQIVELRAKELMVEELYQNVHNKLEKLKECMIMHNVSDSEVAYIGDDLNDIECMCFSGLSACPIDAAEEVKQIADYVCKNKGGYGAVREFVEWIQGKQF